MNGKVSFYNAEWAAIIGLYGYISRKGISEEDRRAAQDKLQRIGFGHN